MPRSSDGQEGVVGGRPEVERARVAQPQPAGGVVPDVHAVAVERAAADGRVGFAGRDGGSADGQQGVLVDELLAVQLAVVELELHPLGQVEHGGGDPAGRILCRRVAGRGHPLAVNALVDDGPVGGGQEVLVDRCGLGHAERFVEGLGRELLPRDAGGGRHRFGSRRDTEVGVAVAGAERVELEQAHLLEDRRSVVAHVLELVAGVLREAGAHRREVGDGGVLGDPRVGELEVGEVGRDGVVPRHGALAHFGGDDGGADALGDRGDLEPGLGVDLVGLADLTHTEAPCVDDFAVADDGDRGARHPGALEVLLDQVRELGDGLVDVGGVDRHVGGGVR